MTASSPPLLRRVLVGVLFGVVVYAGILLYTDRTALLEALADFPLRLIPIACGLSLLNYLLRFLKWERYRSLLGIQIPRGTSLCIYLAGLSMGVTPGKLGEILKSWLLRRVQDVPIHRSAPIVMAERVTDLLGYLILMAIGGLASYPEYQWIFWSTLALCGAGIALVGSPAFAFFVASRIAHTPWVWRFKDKIRGAFESSRILLSPREVVLPTLISTVSWGLECTGFWLIASAFVDGGVPFLFAVFAYAFGAVAGALALFVPGGLGVTEASVGTLLRREYQATLAAGGAVEPLLEVARSKAAGAVLLIRLCTLWFGLAVGLIALAWFQKRYGRIEVETRPESAAESG